MQPAEDKLLTNFIETNAKSIEPKGIFPVMCFCEDSEGELAICSLAVSGRDAHTAAYNMLARTRPVKCAFGWDRFFKSDQGMRHDGLDFLTVTYWDGQQFYYGVMQYRTDPVEAMPVDWDNKFWKNMLAHECWKFRYHNLVTPKQVSA